MIRRFKFQRIWKDQVSFCLCHQSMRKQCQAHQDGWLQFDWTLPRRWKSLKITLIQWPFRLINHIEKNLGLAFPSIVFFLSASSPRWFYVMGLFDCQKLAVLYLHCFYTSCTFSSRVLALQLCVRFYSSYCGHECGSEYVYWRKSFVNHFFHFSSVVGPALVSSKQTQSF